MRDTTQTPDHVNQKSKKGRYFRKFLLFPLSDPSLQLTGDHMASYGTPFAREMGISCGIQDCLSVPPIFTPQPMYRNNLHCIENEYTSSTSEDRIVLVGIFTDDVCNRCL